MCHMRERQRARSEAARTHAWAKKSKVALIETTTLKKACACAFVLAERSYNRGHVGVRARAPGRARSNGMNRNVQPTQPTRKASHSLPSASLLMQQEPAIKAD